MKRLALIGLALLAIVMLISASCGGVTEKPLEEVPWTGEGPPPPPWPGTKWVIPKEEPSPTTSTIPAPSPMPTPGRTPTPTPEQTPTPEPDITPPVISGVNVSHITESTVTIKWETDEPSACQIEYGEDDTRDKLKDLGSMFKTSHSVTLTELKTKDTYEFRIRALDKSENESLSKDYDFTTKTTEELLSAICYPAMTIGSYVHELSFNLFNGSSQKITVTKVEIFDEHGDVAFTMSKSDIAETWGSGKVKPGNSLSARISFQIPPSTKEIEDWRVKWYCSDAHGVKFTVKGKCKAL